MNRYENIVEFWLKELLEDRKLYNISLSQNKDNIEILVKVEEKYIGKIIGKNGNIISSLRNIINSISKNDKTNVKIIVKER